MKRINLAAAKFNEEAFFSKCDDQQKKDMIEMTYNRHRTETIEVTSAIEVVSSTANYVGDNSYAKCLIQVHEPALLAGFNGVNKVSPSKIKVLYKFTAKHEYFKTKSEREFVIVKELLSGALFVYLSDALSAINPATRSNHNFEKTV